MAYELSEKAQKAKKLWQEGCLTNHKNFCEKLKKRYSAYRGILEIDSKAAEWKSKYAPPWVGYIVESTLAGLVDDRLQFRVQAAPRFYNPGEYQIAREGARAHEILHKSQLKKDRFSEKQWAFAMEDAICGLSVTKQYWKRERMTRPRLTVVADEGAAAEGRFIPRLVEEEHVHIDFDGPVTEVVNVEDFYWHESAVELQRSPVVAHRVWCHYSELKNLERNGYYKDCDELKNAPSLGEDYSARRVADGSSRTKDLVEVLEIWWREDDGKIWTVTLGNQAVELSAARPNPFWHGEYPFVVCTTRPDRFAIPGISQVEKIADLQTGHWRLNNQTIDNIEFLNNAIFMFSDDVVDPDAFTFEPGARWPIGAGDPNQAVKSWSPDTALATLTLPFLARFEMQMQNLAGSQPFTSTSEAGRIGADTATEAALATNLAQRSTTRLKLQLNYAYERMGQQRTLLNQQFIRTNVMVEDVGLDTEYEDTEIAPMLLRGEYLFDISPMNESLMRSERRAEANSLFQTFLQAAPLWYQVAAAGGTKPPSFEAFAENWLEKFDVGEPQRFFSAKPPPPPGGAPGQPQQQQPQGEPAPAVPQGVTAPQAIDPMSPSNTASLSGASLLARALSSRGGVSNT